MLLTSASAELEDPSREPRAALVELAGFVRERLNAHTVVLNASTLQPAASDQPAASERSGVLEPDEPASLRIRRVDLAAMEASHESGLSVLDADRLAAEIRLADKVRGPYEYAPEINGALRSMLASILGELGFAQRALMEAHTPYIRQVVAISVEEWLKSEGDVVTAGDVLCRLRLSGLRRLQATVHRHVCSRRSRATCRCSDGS